MKKYLFALVISLLLLGSCNQKPAIKEKIDEQHAVCYQAIDGADTAWLKIDTLKHKLLGTLKFSYANHNKYNGEIKGVISGDTLKGHFNFKLNGVDKWYRNPVAFLKKDGKLTMGVGQIILIMGSAHFDTKIPIDYDKGRFVFEKTDCK